MEQIEAEQERLRDLLAGKDEALTAARPPDGKWSVLENVRHLIFAEQSHLGRFVQGGREWSSFALPHTNGQGQRWFRELGNPEAKPGGGAGGVDRGSRAYPRRGQRGQREGASGAGRKPAPPALAHQEHREVAALRREP